MINVSVVIVCYNAYEHIEDCIKSLLAQTYPKEHFEILFIDNASKDGTLDIIKDYVVNFPIIRLIVNPIIGIATSRNIGIREAKYEYIASTDSDCTVPNDWLNTLVNGYELHHKNDESVVAVGGGNIPPHNSTRFHKALGIFLNSYLGSRGSVQGFRFSTDRIVPHIPNVNVMHTKKILLQIGGYDESFGNIGEDQDVSFRLAEKRYKYYYLNKSFVWHKLRSSYSSWLKNMFIYGKGRMWLLRKHPNTLHLFFVVPMLLVLSLPLGVLPLWRPILIFPLFYCTLIFLYSIWICISRKESHLILILFSLYVGTHLAYGLGEIYGLIKNRDMKKSSRW